MRRLITSCLFLSAVGGLLSSGSVQAAAPAASATAARPALSVNVVTPERQQWPQTLGATGNIAAWQEVAVGAELQGLRLVELKVQVGDRVRRGDLLARLQSDAINAELAISRAGLQEAQAALAEARDNAARARQLQPDGVISTQQGQQLLTGEATAQARVAAQQARVAADELRLGQTRILAPDDGLVSARLATQGAVVGAGQELLRLIRQSRLEWRAEVPAAELARLQPGKPARLDLGGPEPLVGRVRVVAPTVDPASRSGLVYVDLPRSALARAGMHARGEFELGRSELLSLPQSAVLLRDGFAYVFEVGPDQRVRQRKIGIGRRQGERIEVSGLGAQARVVLQGAAFLADGDLVRVVSAPAAPASR